MEQRDPHQQRSDTARDLNREAVATQQVQGRLIGVGVISFALLGVLVSAVASYVAAAPGDGRLDGFLGGPGLAALTAMLMAGVLVILRAAISHGEISRRLEGVCRELESSNARLQEVSFKDEVTDLYNRRFFGIRLEDEVSRYCRFDHPLSLVLLDVDGFKAVNDELGHAAGDETLREIGTILKRHSRSMDVICRYGGDEFAILLVETSKDGALFYAERIRRQVEAARFPHGRAITVSLGVAGLPEDAGPVPDDLVTSADWALYEAKRAGRNRVAERDGAVPVRRGGWDL